MEIFVDQEGFSDSPPSVNDDKLCLVFGHSPIQTLYLVFSADKIIHSVLTLTDFIFKAYYN